MIRLYAALALTAAADLHIRAARLCQDIAAQIAQTLQRDTAPDWLTDVARATRHGDEWADIVANYYGGQQ